MKKSKFQLIIIIVFAFSIVVAVGMFAGNKTNKPGGGGGTVTVWGTVDQSVMGKVVDEFNTTNKEYQLKYNKRQSATFESDLSEAIASGFGPDIVLLSEDKLVRLDSKLYHIPYESLSASFFQSTFTQEGNLFLAPDGVVALPLSIDPLVLYYNRNLLEANGYIRPPETWQDLFDMIPKLTVKDGSRITQSAIALGSFDNVTHAKDILAMLFLQNGNPLGVRTESGLFRATISGTSISDVDVAENVVTFFTQFADPLKPIYTWSQSKDDSIKAFIAGDLVFYIGYMSELPSIHAQNPNLNFAVARVPQQDTERKLPVLTFGKMTGIGVVKTSKNFQSALTTAVKMSEQAFAYKFISEFFTTAPVAPARQDLIVNAPKNDYGALLFNSAIISRSWPDPSDIKSDLLFSNAIEKVTSGELFPDEAVSLLQNNLNLLFESGGL